jgi:hypothetical protein
MNTDIRLPMGMMFTILGVILTGYGSVGWQSKELTKSLGINVNFWWGFVILAFGVSMLSLYWLAARRLAVAARAGVPVVPVAEK